VLKRLPFLTKDIIRRNYNDMRATDISDKEVKQSSTSGSTGESLFFLIDVKRSGWRRASTFRFYQWCGISPFDRHATLWGARFDEPSVKSFGDKLRAWTRPVLFLSTYDLSEETMARYAKLIQDFKPTLLTSYPSPLEHFAKYCLNENIEFSSLRAIICSAEQLFDYQREVIEKAFGVPIFNRYGCREFGDLAQECELHKGLHVNAEMAIIEILREDGTPCQPDEVGELVITDLDNYAMPFIRYKTGDLGSWVKKHCSCGRGLPLLSGIEGRVFDLIRSPSGKTISGTFWTLLLRYISQEIVAFQVVQEHLDTIRLLLQVNGTRLTQQQETVLRQKITAIAPDLRVSIRYVKKIPLAKSGKRRFVISRLPQTITSIKGCS